MIGGSSRMGRAEQLRLVSEGKETLRTRTRKNLNQYFTPEFVVTQALSLVPAMGAENVIDPAVGNGIFLKVAQKQWRGAKLFGIDIDSSIIRSLKDACQPNAYYFQGDSVEDDTFYNPVINGVLLKGGFDLVLGNPPFSSWFHRIDNSKVLANYEISHRNGKIMKSQAIEVLFIERFINLAREGGWVVIVLPDGILSNPQYRYVREYILSRTKVEYIVDLPRHVFHKTSAKTSILLLKKECNIIYYQTRFFILDNTRIIKRGLEVDSKLLASRMDHGYYCHSQVNSFNRLVARGYHCAPLSEFVLYCKTGKTLYGKRRTFNSKGFRFLHATNVTEIGINYAKDEKYIDPSNSMFSEKAYAKKGDIVFARVGVGCAGRTAIIADSNDEGVATDYLHIFRVKGISPYFLVVYLKSRYGVDSINLIKHGVGTISINKTDLLSLPIPIVSDKIQREIESMYKRLLKKYRSNLRDDASSKLEMKQIIDKLEQFFYRGGSKLHLNN